ncbi:protein kinase domain-containing protein [Sorangium sp. So ce388]|uniref:serine/threonine-protein kinase n=1 Tax=Sorangium sp. So ce388 TaxID=3133309 RepID=UPI003F5B36CC
MLLRPGDRIDHYTLVKPLGEGGQGSVWKVIDPREGGVVRALKLVRLEDAGRQRFDRARREAKILASARHPALVVCHAFFEDLHAGLAGLVMDFVRGRSLADAAAEELLDGERALVALEQVASALAYVHGAGLVHRDLKPDNVLLADSFWSNPRRPGAVKLVDFGIAASAGNPRPLTSLGAVVGTIPYMAPELVDPATWRRAEGPSRDLFAFGVMAWEVLFRGHPTGLGPSATLVDYARAYKAAQVGRIAWPPRGLAGPWGAAVGASLALSPLRRPANGAALLEILRTGAAPSMPAAAETPSGVLSAPTSPHRVSTMPMKPPPAQPVAVTQPASMAVPPAQPVAVTQPASMAVPPAQPVAVTQPASMAVPPVQPVAVTQPADRASLPAAIVAVPQPEKTSPPVPSEHVSPPAGRRGAWKLSALALAASMTGTAVALIASGWIGPLVSAITSQDEPMARGLLPPAPASSTPAPLPASAPVPLLPSAASSLEIEACCASRMTCTGPTKFRCPRCTGKAPPLPRGGTWWLRLSSVIDPGTNQDMTTSRRSSTVCMRVGDRTACAPFLKIGSPRGDEDDRLPVTTEDIEDMRIQFSIDDGAYLPGRVNRPPVLVSALCGGLYVHVDDPVGGNLRLSVYLDARTGEVP